MFVLCQLLVLCQLHLDWHHRLQRSVLHPLHLGEHAMTPEADVCIVQMSPGLGHTAGMTDQCSQCCINCTNYHVIHASSWCCISSTPVGMLQEERGKHMSVLHKWHCDRDTVQVWQITELGVGCIAHQWVSHSGSMSSNCWCCVTHLWMGACPNTTEYQSWCFIPCTLVCMLWGNHKKHMSVLYK